MNATAPARTDPAPSRPKFSPPVASSTITTAPSMSWKRCPICSMSPKVSCVMPSATASTAEVSRWMTGNDTEVPNTATPAINTDRPTPELLRERSTVVTTCKISSPTVIGKVSANTRPAHV